jgi:GLPGLI family protein
MNKYHFICIFLFSFLCAPAVRGQQNDVEQAVYRCVYEVFTMKDTVGREKFSVDRMGLDVGSRSAVFYSLRKAQADSIAREAIANMDLSLITQGPKGVNNYIVHRDFAAGKTTFLNQLGSGAKYSYYYEEDQPNPEWTLHAEKADKLGYACQRATCSFGGRNYEAWFTTEIPLPCGPYKFGGLPGLILEIHDDRNHYSFEASGFEKLTPPVPIACPTNKYNKLSKKDYLKIERAYMTDPVAWLAQNAGVRITGMSTPQDREKSGVTTDRYAPIELTD